jgi:hypothetical protein
MKIKSLLLSCVLIAGCGGSTAPLPVLSDKFVDIQKQTFEKTCIGGCHSGDQASALLWLDHDSAYNQLLFNHEIQCNGTAFKHLVVPGNPDSSFLVYKITKAPTSQSANLDYGVLMPNNNTGKLPQNQIDAIISWIKRGAPKDN